ncbi:MAG: NUDIX hydrolase [Firmicutes bacterium]|nr:NUDIX hydrolase [Bacillota bacterium]
MHQTAGGIVYRIEAARPLVLLIRDRYGSWTFPKGHVEAEESLQEAALREIEEETGIRGVVEESLGDLFYTFTVEQGKIEEKQVHYFLVRATGGTPRPQPGETEAVAWFAIDEAQQLLQREGYPNYADLWRRARARLSVLAGHFPS